MDIIDAPSTSEQASQLPSDAKGEQIANKPTCIICLGMAGSGKTTFMQVSNVCDCGFVFNSHFQRISAHLYSKNCPPYCINLDPAVNQVSFPANIGVFVCVHVHVRMHVIVITKYPCTCIY